MADAVVPWAVPDDQPPERIAVGELVFERWTQRDLEPLSTARSESEEHLVPWMSWASQRERSSIAGVLTDSAEGWESGERFEYAIRNRRRELCGGVGLVARIGAGGLEIGYWVHAAHVRQGIATLAAAALADAAFRLTAVDHVEIHHDEANLASGAVPVRLGFRKLGVFPEMPKAPAETGREVRWRMEAGEFAGSGAGVLLEGARADAADDRGPR